ncbi:MAG TPA: ComF family protein [Clostridia bacterium]|nr:ComF family protein [Clostridia bacterium]
MRRQGWWHAFLNILFPEKDVCLFCLQKDKSAEHMRLCHECTEKILKITEELETCPFCGFFTAGDACPTCRSWREKFLRVGTVVPYEGMFRELIHDLKFNGRKDWARPLGYLMACRVRRLGFAEKIQAIIPVPLYSGREKERGFNQSLLLAEVIAAELQKPLWSEALAREHFHHPQMMLSREERMQNIAGAFRYAQGREMRGGMILLVDDIITTGATLLACADILRQVGARDVWAITWAVGYNVKLMEKVAGSWFYYEKAKEKSINKKYQ